MRTIQRSLRWVTHRVFVTLLTALAGGAVLVYLRYRQAMAANEERITHGGKIAKTPRGVIEYGEIGEGQPVLVSHGAGGGYDQGLAFQELVGRGYRLIAPSRFGYLNTPYPSDPSGAAQADAYACLLDYLKIERVHVIAFSAGGPSALQFALRYPERVKALVMVSAISNAKLVDPRPIDLSREPFMSLMLTDFAYWTATTYFPTETLAFFGVSREAQQRLSPEENARLHRILQMMLPIGARKAGNINDPAHWFEKGAFALENIKAPTLVIHAIDDTFVPLAHGQYTANHIPNARLKTYDYGGHLVAVRQVVAGEIKRFLARYSDRSGYARHYPAIASLRRTPLVRERMQREPGTTANTG